MPFKIVFVFSSKGNHWRPMIQFEGTERLTVSAFNLISQEMNYLMLLLQFRLTDSNKYVMCYVLLCV